MNIMTRGTVVLFSMCGLSSAIAAPDIEANHPTMDFESWVRSGQTRVQSTLWIYNRGTSDLHIGDIGAADPLAPPFAIRSGCAHQTLAPSAHCELGIELTTNVPGLLSDSFDIASDDPDESPLTIQVRARVAANFLDGKLDGFAAPAQLTCQNLETGQTVRRRLLDTTRWNCLQAGLLAQSDDSLKVTISGRAEADAIDSAPASPPVSRQILRGGGRAPELVVDPLVNLGRVSTLFPEQVEAVLISNNSDVPVHFIEIATTNPVAEPFFVNVDRLSHETCAPHSGCEGTGGLQIGLRVANGVFSDSFSITTDDPVTPEITVQVVGEGVDDMINATSVGFDVIVTTCRNVTSGQSIVIDGANCTDRGLHAQVGDKIVMTMGGWKQ